MSKERKIILGEFKHAEEGCQKALSEYNEANEELKALAADCCDTIDDALMLAKSVSNLPDKYKEEIQNVQNKRMRVMETLIAGDGDEEKPGRRGNFAGKIFYGAGHFVKEAGAHIAESRKPLNLEELKKLSDSIHKYTEDEAALRKETEKINRRIADLKASDENLLRITGAAAGIANEEYGAFKGQLKAKLKEILSASGALADRINQSL